MPPRKNKPKPRKKVTSLRLFDVAALAVVANRLDEGKPGSSRVSTQLMAGNIGGSSGAFAQFAEGTRALVSSDGIKDLVAVVALSVVPRVITSFTKKRPGVTIGGFRVSI